MKVQLSNNIMLSDELKTLNKKAIKICITGNHKKITHSGYYLSSLD